MKSFGEKTYTDYPFKKKNIGIVHATEASKQEKPKGAQVPEKQFMKTVGYENDDKSLVQTTYVL